MSELQIGIGVGARWEPLADGRMICTSVGRYPDDWQGEKTKVGDIRGRVTTLCGFPFVLVADLKTAILSPEMVVAIDAASSGAAWGETVIENQEKRND